MGTRTAETFPQSRQVAKPGTLPSEVRAQRLILVAMESMGVLVLNEPANRLFVADMQQQKAAARRMLPAGQRRRYVASIHGCS
jgi:hypothetical protein